jgi:hypothetical protein
MDWKTFIADMTRSLAWPVALVAVGLLFRRTIGDLLEGVRLRRIGRGEWSADFEAAAREVRAELPSSIEQPPALAQTQRLQEAVRMVDLAPSVAIAEEWNKLEDYVKAIATRSGVQQQVLPEVLRALVEKGVVRSATADAILGLRNMRNLAVHAPPERLTRAQALEFITMADALTWNLEHDLKKMS